MEIKTRKQASADGDHKYFTGKSCTNDHLGPRYTASGICCKCNSENVKKYNAKMRTGVQAKQRGLFTREIHPDDHAAVHAYCDALDLQRGRLPQSPVNTVSNEVASAIAQTRAALVKPLVSNTASHIPQEFKY